LKSRMLDEGLCTEADFKKLEQEVIETVTASVQFADESPFPDPGALHEDVYVEGRP
jgi:pyruvate dehydrogenase E1 component alpha subunit